MSEWLSGIINWLANNILNVLILVVFFMLFRKPGKKNIKAGASGFEFSMGNDVIPPDTPCPYKTSYNEMLDIANDMNHKVESNLGKIMDDLAKLSITTDSNTKLLWEINIDQFKMMFYDTNLETEERLAAGLKYLKNGGNHKVKKDIEKFARDNKSVYNALCIGAPELKRTVGDI